MVRKTQHLIFLLGSMKRGYPRTAKPRSKSRIDQKLLPENCKIRKQVKNTRINTETAKTVKTPIYSLYIKIK